ncbi:MAG TPA: polysaccharide deacetylase family protein [Terriglobia bacterium]|nr:polysaccharide deacetylase family protein [Terriglobia bacterium]
MRRRQVVQLLASAMSPHLTRAMNRINGRRGGVILVFHEITGPRLETQLNQVAEAYSFVSLDEFVSRLAAGKSTNGVCAITFDDGIGPVTEDASAIAVARGWPMTFYLPTRYLDTGEPYWFLELDLLLERAPGKGFEFDGGWHSLDGPTARAGASVFLRSYFKKRTSVQEVTDSLRALRRALLENESRPMDMPVPAPVSWERVRQLAAREELSFQAHTVNHLALSRLSEEGLISEMESSRVRIEEVTGRPVNHFCYPYGSPNEVGRIAPDFVRSRFRSATTTDRGRCAPGVDLALLPRVPLDGADSEEVVAFKVGSAR